MKFVYVVLMNTIVICPPWFDAFSDGHPENCTSENACETATAAAPFEPKHRAVNCQYNEIENYCDSNISPGWYRFDFDLVTYPPALGSCGAEFPYWLNGTIPFGYGEEKYGTVCKVGYSHNCTSQVTIIIRNCGSFRAYCLPALNDCRERYCFGEVDPTCQSSKAEDITTTVTVGNIATSSSSTSSVTTKQIAKLPAAESDITVPITLLPDADSVTTHQIATLPAAESETTVPIATLPSANSTIHQITTQPGANSVTTDQVATLPSTGSETIDHAWVVPPSADNSDTTIRIATVPDAASRDNFNTAPTVLLVLSPSILAVVILTGILIGIKCFKKPRAINVYDHINLCPRNLEEDKYDQLTAKMDERQSVVESMNGQYVDPSESVDNKYVDLSESMDNQYVDLSESKDVQYVDLSESKNSQYVDLSESKNSQYVDLSESKDGQYIELLD